VLLGSSGPVKLGLLRTSAACRVINLRPIRMPHLQLHACCGRICGVRVPSVRVSLSPCASATRGECLWVAFGGKADDDLQGLLDLARRAWMFLICIHTYIHTYIIGAHASYPRRRLGRRGGGLPGPAGPCTFDVQQF